MTPSDRPAPDAEDRLPRHTTPTWEVELLISGVAVFAMLQLPGWLNDKLLFLLPRFDESWRAPLRIVSLYCLTAATILAATFAVHLLLRAYWIALVGMHSVYPDGIRWERLRLGPIEREILQRDDNAPTGTIDRADNRASIVFAMGVVLASTLLVLSVLIVGLFALVMAVVMLVRLPFPADLVFSACAVAVALPLVLMNVLDRGLGARSRAENPLRRLIAAAFRYYASIGLGSQGGVIGLLASHHGRRRIQVIAIAVMTVCILATMTGQKAMRTPERLGNYAWFPHFDAPAANVVDAAHYDDQRDPLRGAAVPYVQSAVIPGDYARLVVPYQPDGDAAAMRRRCSAAPAIADDDARAAEMLRCLAALHAVTLDGKPLASLRYDAGSDPRTDRPALIAMIDVRALAPGRHVLRVANPASAEQHDRRDAAAASIIPFWR